MSISEQKQSNVIVFAFFDIADLIAEPEAILIFSAFILDLFPSPTNAYFRPST